MTQKLLPEMEESVRLTLRLMARLDSELEQLDEERKKAVQRVAETFKGRRSEKKVQRTHARRGIEIQTRMKYEELVRLYGDPAAENQAESEAVTEAGHESVD